MQVDYAPIQRGLELLFLGLVVLLVHQAGHLLRECLLGQEPSSITLVARDETRQPARGRVVRCELGLFEDIESRLDKVVIPNIGSVLLARMACQCIVSSQS